MTKQKKAAHITRCMGSLYQFIYDSAINRSWHYPLNHDIIDRINQTAGQWFFAQNVAPMATKLRESSVQYFDRLALGNLAKTVQRIHVENHIIAILEAAIAHSATAAANESSATATTLALQALLMQAYFNAIELSYGSCLMMLHALQYSAFVGQLLNSHSLPDFEMLVHCFASRSDLYADSLQSRSAEQAQVCSFINYQLNHPTIAYQIAAGMAFSYLRVEQELHFRAHTLAVNFWQISVSQTHYLMTIHTIDAPAALTAPQIRTITARMSIEEDTALVEADYPHWTRYTTISPEAAHHYYQTFAALPSPSALDHYLQGLPQAPDGYHDLLHALDDTDHERLATIYRLLQDYLQRKDTKSEQVEYKADFSIICRVVTTLTTFYSEPTERSEASYRDEINLAVKILELCQTRSQQNVSLMVLMRTNLPSHSMEEQLLDLLKKFQKLHAGLQVRRTKSKNVPTLRNSTPQPTSTAKTEIIHDTVVALTKLSLTTTSATPAQQQFTRAQSVSLQQFDGLFNYHYLNSATTTKPQHDDEKDYRLLQSTRDAIAAFKLAQQNKETTVSQQAAYLIVSNNLTRIELSRIMKKMQQRLTQWQVASTHPEQPRHKAQTRIPLLFAQQFLEIGHLLLQSHEYVNELGSTACDEELKQQLSSVTSDWDKLHTLFKRRGQTIKDAITRGILGRTPLANSDLPQRQQLYSDLANCQQELAKHLKPVEVSTSIVTATV